jgi:hypothetical protein
MVVRGLSLSKGHHRECVFAKQTTGLTMHATSVFRSMSCYTCAIAVHLPEKGW